MTTLGIIIYLIGAFISYVMIISITENTFNGDTPRRASKLLIYVTIISYVLGSWMCVMLLGGISLVDPHFRRICLFPLHLKLKSKL